MATATPPSQPSSDEAAQIVGEHLQDGAIAAMRREFEARFSQQDRAIAELRRDLRWGFGLIITIGVALLIAVLTAMISLLSNGA